MKKKMSSVSSQRAKRRQASAAAMKRAKKLPLHLQAELKALDKLRDENIDTSDIPEITDAEWARRDSGPLYRPVKKSVSLRLDADVLEWFKSKGRGYQTTMNRVLRSYFSSNH